MSTTVTAANAISAVTTGRRREALALALPPRCAHAAAAQRAESLPGSRPPAVLALLRTAASAVLPTRLPPPASAPAPQGLSSLAWTTTVLSL